MSMDYKVRMYANADWQDITGDVQPDRGGVQITMGRSSESSSYQPSTARFTVDNRSGNYSTVNPNGTYYGSLNNNTPVEIYRSMVSALFASTVSSAWPDAQFLPDLSALTWTTFGSGGVIAASDYSSSGGRGNHSVPAANAYRSTYLAAVDYRNVDLTVDLKLDTTNITGAPVSWNVIGRASSTSVNWRLAVQVETTEAITLILTDDDGVPYDPVTVVGITHATAQSLRLRVQFEDDTIRAKLWVVGTGEPYDWALTVYAISGFDDTVASSTGWVGLQSRRDTGNSNGTLVFSYDNFDLRFNRFAGEVSSWPVEWDTTGRDIYSAIEAAGVLRRVGISGAPIQSPPRSWIPTTFVDNLAVSSINILVYVPLEERPQAEHGSPVIGPYFALLATTVKAASEQWGNGDLAPWLHKVLAMYGDSELRLAINQTNFATSWRIDMVCKSQGDQTFTWNIQAGSFVWQLSFSPSAKTVTVVHPGGTGAPVDISAEFFDSATHTVTFSAGHGGGTISWNVRIDGVTVDSQSTAGTLQALLYMWLNSVAPHSSPLSVGHIVAYDGGFASSTDVENAAAGFPGELSGYRLSRLATNEGIPFFNYGHPFGSMPTGEQTLAATTSQLDDCERVDGGLLYDARGTLGVAYRTYSKLVNQSPGVTLTYSLKQLVLPFAPTKDDRLTRNDVIATSSNRGEAQATQTDGPMSTLAPSAGGIGRYFDSVSVNPSTSAQVADIASWQVHLGTVNEARVPDICVNLDRSAITPALLVDLLQLTVGDVIQVDMVPALAGGSVSQLIVGYEETIDQFVRHIRFHCVPASPYLVGEADNSTPRIAAGSSYLNANVTSGATSFAVKSLDGSLWSTAAADLPVSVKIGGEEMSVAVITGSSSPQTFSTVTRSVNNIVKAHVANDTETARVQCLHPAVVAMGDY